jgi:hypothetical protein
MSTGSIPQSARGPAPTPALGGREAALEPLQLASAAVLHAPEAATRPEVPPAADKASCAHCRGPIPIGTSGRRRHGTRYCSPRCRHAATAERRAEARFDLLLACEEAATLAGHLADVAGRIARDLQTMGFKPKRPRKRRERS